MRKEQSNESEVRVSVQVLTAFEFGVNLDRVGGVAHLQMKEEVSKGFEKKGKAVRT